MITQIFLPIVMSVLQVFGWGHLASNQPALISPVVIDASEGEGDITGITYFEDGSYTVFWSEGVRTAGCLPYFECNPNTITISYEPSQKYALVQQPNGQILEVTNITTFRGQIAIRDIERIDPTVGYCLPKIFECPVVTSE